MKSKKPVDSATKTCDCCGAICATAKRNTIHYGCSGLSPALVAHVAANPKLAGKLRGQAKGTWR